MVANERQLEITRGQIRRFQHAIDNHPECPKDVDPIIHQASLDAQVSMLDELTEQIALFLKWQEFMKGEWIQTVPQREGTYAILDRTPEDGRWNTRVVYKDPVTDVFTARTEWKGFFWSVPFPPLPTPGPWIRELTNLEIHSVSVVDKCPYCGGPFTHLGKKADGSVCDHPTKLSSRSGMAIEGRHRKKTNDESGTD